MEDIHKMTITQVKEFLEQLDELPEEVAKAIETDERKGVFNAYQSFLRKKEKAHQLRLKWEEMSRYEKELWHEGYHWVAGIDEVGRGPLAGPVVTAAVILPSDLFLPGLNDSKKLSAGFREELYEIIMEKAVAVSFGSSEHDVIDEINIYQATLRAMEQAIASLPIQPDFTLNDAVTLPNLSIPQRPLIGGDGKSVSIAAASVVAKVTRDRLMKEYDQMYPGYGFATNMGYGTEEHLAHLRKVGPCPIHRRSFAGVLSGK